jgi:hypothetical protein
MRRTRDRWTTVLAAALAVTASAGLTRAQKHPHFDDGGTLVWHTKLSAAKEAAAREDRVILVEYGRKA